MSKVFKERVAHILEGIEDKISSMHTVDFNTAITSCRAQTEIKVLGEILDKGSEEYKNLLSINRKAIDKHKELGVSMIDYLSDNKQ